MAEASSQREDCFVTLSLYHAIGIGLGSDVSSDALSIAGRRHDRKHAEHVGVFEAEVRGAETAYGEAVERAALPRGQRAVGGVIPPSLPQSASVQALKELFSTAFPFVTTVAAICYTGRIARRRRINRDRTSARIAKA